MNLLLSFFYEDGGGVVNRARLLSYSYKIRTLISVKGNTRKAFVHRNRAQIIDKE